MYSQANVTVLQPSKTRALLYVIEWIEN